MRELSPIFVYAASYTPNVMNFESATVYATSASQKITELSRQFIMKLMELTHLSYQQLSFVMRLLSLNVAALVAASLAQKCEFNVPRNAKVSLYSLRSQFANLGVIDFRNVGVCSSMHHLLLSKPNRSRLHSCTWLRVALRCVYIL